MSLIKQLGTVFVLCAILIGNIGINVFTHNCSIDGKETSYFFQSEDHCNDKHNEIVSSSCCAKKTENKGCCSTEAQFVQLKVDVTNTLYQVEPVLVTALVVNPSFVQFQLDCESLDKVDCTQFYRPPPQYQGRNIHQLNEVYII